MISKIFILKTLIITYLIYKYGFTYGIIISILLFFSYKFAHNKFLKICFKLEGVDGLTRMFALMPDSKKFIMTGYLILDDYKPDQWKDLIIQRGINNFPQLRKVLTFYNDNIYWKEVDKELAYKNIKIFNNIKLNSIQEVCDYSIKQQQIIYNFNEIPYEFHIMKYGDKGGIIFLKFDHTLSDGIGYLGFLIALSDNYDISLFPQMKEISFFTNLLITILSPYYAYKTHGSTIRIHSSPFKREYDHPGKKLIYISDKINYEKVSKCCKKMALTFNEFLLCIASKNYKQYVKHLDSINATKSYLKTFTINLPLSLRPFPKKLEDFVIDNSLTSHAIEIPLINDYDSESKLMIKKALEPFTKNIFKSYGIKLYTDTMVHYVPAEDISASMEGAGTPFDLAFSNVPGPRKALYYAGSKVNSIMATPQQGFFYNTIVIISYDGEFCIASVSDDKVEANMEIYVKMIERDIDYLVNNLLE